MTMTPSFRTCLDAVLAGAHGSLPEPEGDELVFWRQWLAQRNLGLVAVAAPEAFSWAGHWIALVRDDAGARHAVLMYGVPSGPVLDPDGVGGAPIEEAFVVAPLDIHLDREQPYGTEPGEGVVAGLFVAPEAEAPMTRLENAHALAGKGLEGDRYALDRGTFSGSPGKGYDLTLVTAEALEQLEREGIPFSWEEARRNVVTRGIDLNALVGKRFTIGEVTCYAQRLDEPCIHLERLTKPGVLRGLVHRSGIRVDILTDGEIAVGDRIAVA
jgi:MOSC domain-containing protein YiiM